MTYWVYTNSDSSTQLFIGILLIVSLSIVMIGGMYLTISDFIKKRKQK